MSSSPLAMTSASKEAPDEWRTRVDLAACYRLLAHFRMTDLTYTHISARVPGADERFLLNAFGLLFEEVTASSLVTVNAAGAVLHDATGLGINPAGFVIHSAVHAARPDINCVLHTHTMAGMAVAAQEEGLLPLTQHAMRFHGRLGYHEYEGIALDQAERQRLARDLGPHSALILRNHGLLTCGSSIAEAFNLMYYLERACQAQVGALAGGRPLHMPSAEAMNMTARIFADAAGPAMSNDWRALLRMLDRIDASYKE
jgi:ribulose-5-phosphate 4-epimerase/fuculose-1-phosphate aldolase